MERFAASLNFNDGKNEDFENLTSKKSPKNSPPLKTLEVGASTSETGNEFFHCQNTEKFFFSIRAVKILELFSRVT